MMRQGSPKLTSLTEAGEKGTGDRRVKRVKKYWVTYSLYNFCDVDGLHSYIFHYDAIEGMQ